MEPKRVPTVPAWFGECRYGLMVTATIASVPCFAPIGEYAEWYWAHLQPGLQGVKLHPRSPMPEIVAHHREQYGEAPFDAFVDRLTFENFDADALASAVLDAGMRYLVFTAKHHDGFCWWDSPLTERTSVRRGPRRDIVAEVAAACTYANLDLGLSYSLLDWSRTDPGPAAARLSPEAAAAHLRDYAAPQVRELVDRFAPSYLYGDGPWAYPDASDVADGIVEDYRAAMHAAGRVGVVNDQWGASAPDVTTFEYELPSEPVGRAWELCRGLARSFGYNRREPAYAFLEPAELVGLLTEVVAKGGNLLVSIGPRADGSFPEDQVELLRDAGRWLADHHDVIHGTRGLPHWGDTRTRYLMGADDAVRAVDLSGARERVFEHVEGVLRVTGPDGALVSFSERADGLHVRRPPEARPSYADVYRIELFDPTHVHIDTRSSLSPRAGVARVDDETYPDVHAALAAAGATGRPTIVELTSGRYPVGDGGPLRIPADVTLRGPQDAVIDGSGGLAVILDGDGAALHGVTVVHGAPEQGEVPPVVVASDGASRLDICDCVLDSLEIRGGERHRIAGNTVAWGSIRVDGVRDALVVYNRQNGLPWGSGISLRDCGDVLVCENDVTGPLCGIRVVRGEDVRIVSNRIIARWWGVHFRESKRCAARRNEVSLTMRAVEVDGGDANIVTLNTALRCDSGTLLEGGAHASAVMDNVYDRCRVGMYLWAEDGTTTAANTFIESRERDVIRP